MVDDRTAQLATDCFAALAMTTLAGLRGERFCGCAAKPFSPTIKSPVIARSRSIAEATKQSVSV